jgi:hypothetical protein
MNVLRSLTVAIAAFTLAAPLAAQDASRLALTGDPVTDIPSITRADTAAMTVLLPTPSAARSAMLLRLSLADDAGIPPMVPPIPARTSRNSALMIVGGAGMIVGAVVGGRSGNVIMVGGGLVGLIGLWNYLK